ncbi:MAG: hypothetical protein R3F61_08340 [Myxococcota bacterium]
MWTLLAWAAAAPRYNADDITLHTAKQSTGELRTQVQERLKQRKITLHRAAGAEREVLYPAPKGGPGLDALDRPALLALVIGSQDSGEPGMEYDLVFADDDGAMRPVTLWIEDRTHLVVSEGGRMPTPAKGPSAETLVRTYGLAGLAEVDAVFEPGVRGALDTALSMLSAEERAGLADITLVRQGQASRKQRVAHAPSWVNTATYVLEDNRGWIEVYDEAVQSASRFVGPIDQPVHPTVFVLLHELGHAIADAPFRAQLREHERRRLAFNDALTAFKADQAAYNAAVTRHNANPKSKEGGPLAEQLRELREREDAMKTENAALQVLGAEIDANSDLTPVARRYAEAVGKRRSPTQYGETSVDEAFAEAFALFHADPDALKRTVPAAFDWFARGAHLER